MVGVVSDTEMYIIRREHMETKLNFLHSEILSKAINQSKKKWFRKYPDRCVIVPVLVSVQALSNKMNQNRNFIGSIEFLIL